MTGAIKNEPPTERTMSRAEAEKLLRSADHDRDLLDVVGTITAIEYPTAQVLRFTASLSHGADDPTWSSPNVAIRMELGPDFDDASRVYTVRRFLAETASIEVDVVLHGTESPMMRWSAALRVGGSFRFRGPRRHFIVPELPERPVALFLDATAIPAFHAMLAQWPAGRAGGVAWVDTGDEAAFAELPSVPGLVVHRIDSSAGDQGLPSHAMALKKPEEHVVWGAGERDVMREIRTYFRSAVGLTKDEVAIFGYWKHGVTSADVDLRRLQTYQRITLEGGSLEDLDDFSVDI